MFVKRDFTTFYKQTILVYNTAEVKEGDRVGIIGKNGAGKLTLLKILSRITSPTKGNIVIRCRVGSLLEVGTRTILCCY